MQDATSLTHFTLIRIIILQTAAQKPRPLPRLLQRHRRRNRRRSRLHRHRGQTPLHASKPTFALIENSIHTPQEHAPQNVKVLAAAGLNPAVGRPVGQILEGKVARLDLEEAVADGEGDRGQGGEVCRRREDPALLFGVVRGAWDLAVDSLAEGVADEAQRRARVGDGAVAGAVVVAAVDGREAGLEHPEAVARVDRRVDGLFAFERVPVDVAEGEEALLGFVT